LREKLIAAAISFLAIGISACHVQDNSADFIPNGKFAANAAYDTPVCEVRNAPRRKIFVAFFEALSFAAIWVRGRGGIICG
jgi:hypothetical protein